MGVQVFERASASFAASLAKRGHHIVYRANSLNHCPGCGRSQWYIGRISAECGFCGTAVPLAEAAWQEATPRAASAPNAKHVEHVGEPTPVRAHGRQRPRASIADRRVTDQLRAAEHFRRRGDGRQRPELTPGAKVHVRFEGGILVPAIVKWTEDGLVGLAFVDPIMLDRSADPTN